MLTVTYLRTQREEAIERLKKRGNLDPTSVIDTIISLDDQRKQVIVEVEQLKAELNTLSKTIGQLFQSGQVAEANAQKEQTAQIKEQVPALEERLKTLETEITEQLYTLPNTPHISIKHGYGADDNENTHQEGELPELGETALCHWDLATQYDIIDFELGSKVTGAGFPFYKGKGAKFQRALINYFLDQATAFGYREIQAPILVNSDSGFGTGQLPDKEGQMYYVNEDQLYLIPTAEVPITNIFRDTILKASDFPIKCCGYTPCFRREAGSYGKDVRGLNRLHQFDKVEIMQVQHPEHSYQTLEEMKDYVAQLLRSLGLPFRILKLCGGDMGFASAWTYDFETYSAAQKRWLEVSSVSNFEGFQANRLKLRYKDETGKTQLAHTLNGSALALPRIVATILENNQTPEGVKVPDVLVPYTGFNFIN